MTTDKFEYFLEITNKRLDRHEEKTDLQFDKVEKKLDQLISFRVMLIGASITVSSIVSVGLTLLEIWILHK